jgi:hypothetical protein
MRLSLLIAEAVLHRESVREACVGLHEPISIDESSCGGCGTIFFVVIR